MEPELRALLAGVAAGLAVAVPLGAIGVLVVSEGLHRGWRSASAAATGVALVDLGYATVATAAGSTVTQALHGRTRAVQLVGAAVLVAVAVRGLLGLRTTSADTRGAPPADHRPGPATPAARSIGPVLRRFVALTAVNPLTAVYFAVLAAGLGTTVAGWRAGSAFVVGVFAGSLTWQLVLAAVGAFAGARLPSWARTATGLVGYVAVVGYAVRLAAG